METKATRRRRGEVPRLVLEAARDLFAKKGFKGTSTREIAERAGVSEPLIFLHFGSKSELFDKAVLGPFDEFVDEFVTRWESELQFVSNEDFAQEYFTRLYDLLSTHKELVRALLGASAFEDEFNLGDGRESHLSQQLGRLDALMEDQRQVRGLSGDILLASRIGFGAVLATAVLEDWIFPKDARHPSRAELISHLSRYAIYSTRFGENAGASPRLGQKGGSAGANGAKRTSN